MMDDTMIDIFSLSSQPRLCSTGIVGTVNVYACVISNCKMHAWIGLPVPSWKHCFDKYNGASFLAADEPALGTRLADEHTQ